MANRDTITEIPADYKDSEMEIMSNYDHIIHDEVVERLMNNKEYAGYPGWHFYATVWFDAGLETWFGMVSQYQCHVATITADTPDELRIEICDKYGYD